MSDPVTIALIVSLAPVLATTVSSAVLWVQGRATHTIVNSQRTIMMTEIDVLKKELADMRFSMAQMRSLTDVAKPSN